MAIAPERGYVVQTWASSLHSNKAKWKKNYSFANQGCEIKDEPTGLPLVMKLKKSLYGPRQGPRDCGNTFAKGFKEIRFIALGATHAYICAVLDRQRHCCVYVDGCTFVSWQDTKRGSRSEGSAFEQVLNDGRWASYTTFGNGDVPEKCAPVATPSRTAAEIEREPENAIYLKDMDTKFYDIKELLGVYCSLQILLTGKLDIMS